MDCTTVIGCWSVTAQIFPYAFILDDNYLLFNEVYKYSGYKILRRMLNWFQYNFNRTSEIVPIQLLTEQVRLFLLKTTVMLYISYNDCLKENPQKNWTFCIFNLLDQAMSLIIIL